MCHSLPKRGKRQCQASHIRGNIHQVGPFPKIYRAVLYVNRQDCNIYYCDVRLTSWTDLLLLENSTSNKNEVEKVKRIIALNSSKYNLQKALGLVWQWAVLLTACRPQWHAWQKGRELAKAKMKMQMKEPYRLNTQGPWAASWQWLKPLIYSGFKSIPILWYKEIRSSPICSLLWTRHLIEVKAYQSPFGQQRWHYKKGTCCFAKNTCKLQFVSQRFIRVL